MMKSTNRILMLQLIVWVFLSCDDKPKNALPILLPPPIKGSVMIANEGNFQFGNSSLTVLDLAESNLTQNVFEKVNTRVLGDVFQSINVINGNAYLVVNNSAKIEIVNPQSFKSLATITGFVSPRYILQVSETKAYVTEYYSEKIRVVDLTSNTIVDHIPLSGWGEEMLMYNGKVYVTNTRKRYVYIVNTANNTLQDSIKVVYGSNSIRLDANNNIWVLSSGDKTSSVQPALQRINTQADSVDLTFSLTNTETAATRLRINKEKTTLYWLSKHIYSHNITSPTLTENPFIRAIGQNFYGLDVNPLNNELYVSDAKDFVQQSVITRYQFNGNLMGEFNAGIIASDFYFYYP